MSYRAECAESKGPGKQRGSFDFAHHYEELKSSASVKTGDRLVYMPLTKWFKVAQEDQGLDCKEAKKMLDQKKKTLPQNRWKRNINKVLLLPMPAESYIVGENCQSHEKGMRLQGKSEKKPTAQKLEGMEKLVSGGHFGFGDRAFKQVGGGDLAANAQAGLSINFAPDGDSVFGSGKNFRDAPMAEATELKGDL